MAKVNEKIDSFLGKLYFRTLGILCFIAAVLIGKNGIEILLAPESELGGLLFVLGGVLFLVLGFYLFGKKKRISDLEE